MMDSNEHLYPMRKFWQGVNRFAGFWMWLTTFSSIIGGFFLIPFFKWMRRVIPAYRHMRAGEKRSYIKISKEGLVYRNYPLVESRCKWENTVRINFGRWLGDALFIERKDEIGFPEFSLNTRYQQIHLSSLMGWKEGDLEKDLRKYAPHLFK